MGNIVEELKAQEAAIAALPEVARLTNMIKCDRDVVRGMVPKLPRAFISQIEYIMGDLDLVLELLLNKAILAAYNLGWEQRCDDEFEQGRISKEEEWCMAPRGK